MSWKSQHTEKFPPQHVHPTFSVAATARRPLSCGDRLVEPGTVAAPLAPLGPVDGLPGAVREVPARALDPDREEADPAVDPVEPLPPEPTPPAPVPAATQEVKSFPRPETAISQKPKLKPEATG